MVLDIEGEGRGSRATGRSRKAFQSGFPGKPAERKGWEGRIQGIDGFFFEKGLYRCCVTVWPPTYSSQAHSHIQRSRRRDSYHHVCA